MSAPQFYTVEMEGFAGRGGAKHTLDCLVLDRFYSHTVAHISSGFGVAYHARARATAAAECARLNAEHEAWLAESVA